MLAYAPYTGTISGIKFTGTLQNSSTTPYFYFLSTGTNGYSPIFYIIYNSSNTFVPAFFPYTFPSWNVNKNDPIYLQNPYMSSATISNASVEIYYSSYFSPTSPINIPLSVSAP